MLTGFAGLVAGAISMALGEYTSVRTQTEQVAAEVAKERRELERNPEVETEELAQLWIARGPARRPGPPGGRGRCTRNPDEALRVHAQEELGVDPHEQPSPWTAAISSFICFAVGALIPLLPYLFGVRPCCGRRWSAGGLGLFLAGALVGPVHRGGGGCSAGCASCCSARPRPVRRT